MHPLSALQNQPLCALLAPLVLLERTQVPPAALTPMLSAQPVQSVWQGAPTSPVPAPPLPTLSARHVQPAQLAARTRHQHAPPQPIQYVVPAPPALQATM